MKKFEIQHVVVFYGGSPRHEKAGKPEIRHAKDAYRAAQNAIGTRGKLINLSGDGYGPIFVKDDGKVGFPSPPEDGVMVTPAKSF